MSGINKNYYIVGLILLITFSSITYINSYVECDDGESACDNNYNCCKKERSKGYICCHVNYKCCNKGQDCCEKKLLSIAKLGLEKQKYSFSLLEMNAKNSANIENSKDNKTFLRTENNVDTIYASIFKNFKNSLKKFKEQALMNSEYSAKYLIIMLKEFLTEIETLFKKLKNKYTKQMYNEFEKLKECLIEEFISFDFFKSSFDEFKNAVEIIEQFKQTKLSLWLGEI